MGQNWDAVSDKLTGTFDFTPVKVTPRRIASRKVPVDRARIDKEAERRIEEVDPPKPKIQELSRVEMAMRKNAPDLAGAPEEEVAAAQARRTAYQNAKWPRPRVLALIVAGTIAFVQPLILVRLALWGVIMFLVASVAIGPERARDGAKFLWRRFLRFWKVELFLGARVAKSVRQRLDESQLASPKEVQNSRT